MKKVFKKTAKIAGYTLLVLVGLLAILLITLRIPAVQTYVANKATAMVAEKTGGRIRVAQVRINFLDNVLLKGLYVEEPDGDTLLYAGRLEVDISLWRLLKQQVYIDLVEITDATARITQSTETGDFNFQYIIDAFSDSTKPVDTTTSNWQISANRAYLSNVDFGLDIDGLKLASHFGILEVTLDELDLNNQRIAGEDIDLLDSYVYLTLTGTNDTSLIDTVATTADSALYFPLPDIGWAFTLDEMNLQRVHIKLDQAQQPRLAKGFDYNHLDLQDINIALSDFSWEQNYLTLNIDGISLKSAEGTVVQNLSGYIEATDKMLTVNDLKLQTAGIDVDWDAKINYNSFNDLLTLGPTVGMEVDLRKTKVKVADLEPFLPFLWTDSILAPTARQASLNIILHAEGTLGDIEVSKLRLETNSITAIELSGSAKGLPDYNNASYTLNLKEVTTNYYDVLGLIGNVGIPVGVGKFGTISLTGNITGKLADLNAQNILLTTTGTTGLKGDIKAVGLPDIDNAKFTIDLEYLRTNAREIAPLLSDTLPAELTKLGNIAYSGTFEGTIYDMALSGLLTTSLGSLQATVEAQFNQAYTHATYKARIKLDTFQLGKLLDSEDLGSVSLTATANGEGLNIDSLHTEFDVVVSSIEAMKYNYTDIIVSGKMDRKQFKGNIKIDDPNLKFDFDGLVNLNESAPSFGFNAYLDTINLQKLNLSNTPLGISLELEVGLTGLSSKDIDGKAAIRNILVSDSITVYSMDSLVVDAFDSDTGKTITIQSPILNGYIAGKYNLEALPRELQAFVESYINNVSDSLNKPYQPLVPQQFDMLLTISNPQPLLNLVVPGLILDTATITGRFDNQKNDLVISAVIPDVRYDSVAIERVTLRTGGRGQRFGAILIVDTLTYGDDIEIPHTRLFTFISNDSLRYGLSMYDQDTSFYRLRLGGYMQQNNDEYWFSFDRPMILNGDTWQNLEGNRLVVDPKGFTFDRLGFQNGQRMFQLNTLDSMAAGKSPLELRFNNFPLAELSELISYDGIEMSGTINGTATVYDVSQGLDFVSDIKIETIQVNENEVGNLSIKASRKADIIDVGVALTGNNRMDLVGQINTQTQSINGGFDLKRLDLNVLDPFLKDFIKESSGYLSAEAGISGTFKEPDIKGSLTFNNIKTFVIFAGTSFQMPNNRIDFTGKQISLNSFKIIDARNESANITGNIRHQYFSDIEFDLGFNTNNFMFMNTPPNVKELFYGKLVLGINARITGTPTLPKVDISTVTKEGTNMTVAPLNLTEGVQDASYVIYYNPNSGDTLAKQKQYNVATLPIDLTVNLEVTNNARFEVMIDPATGDKLVIKGNGNMAVNVPANGNISIIGGFEIDSGSYRMTQYFLKKTFIIAPGSRIDISGDPMDARLSIDAIYRAERVSTYPLIGDQATLTPQEESDARKPQPVKVVLIMRGVLSKPELSFDIRFSEGQGLNNLAERRLQQIRQDQNELNKQVFGLLLLNSFITDDGFGGGGGGVPGGNAALKSVSGLINQQLNRFAGKLKGFSVNIDASTYQGYNAGGNGNNTVTEVGLNVSQVLFNDRLEIKAGGDVNVESNTGDPNQGSGFTQWAGDFVVEYKLTESGKYRVKIFNTSDYNLLYQNNVNRTGVGLTFQHSFRRRKKKDKEELAPTSQPDESPAPNIPIVPSETIPAESPKNEEQE